MRKLCLLAEKKGKMVGIWKCDKGMMSNHELEIIDIFFINSTKIIKKVEGDKDEEDSPL